MIGSQRGEEGDDDDDNGKRRKRRKRPKETLKILIYWKNPPKPLSSFVQVVRACPQKALLIKFMLPKGLKNLNI